MPDFLGQTLGTVTNTLHDAGFALGRITMATPPPSSGENSAPANSAPGPLIPTSPSPASIIVSQDPAPGAKVLAGSAINFAVR